MNKLTIKEYLKVLYRKFLLKMYCHAADMKQAAYNKQYYVLPVGKGLAVFSPDDIGMLKKPIRRKHFEKGHYIDVVKKDGSKKKKYVKGGIKVDKIYQMNPNASHQDIMKECFYYTSAKLNELNLLTPAERKQKQAEWLKYAANHK